MKKLIWTLAVVTLFTLGAFAQEHYTEGPVWAVTTIRVKPAHMDDYLTALRREIKPFWDEAKRQGVIMDWKVFLKETKNNPQDWDVALAVLYRNHAQMDGLAAKLEAVRDKVLGGKNAAQQADEKRGGFREVVSDEWRRAGKWLASITQFWRDSGSACFRSISQYAEAAHRSQCGLE